MTFKCNSNVEVSKGPVVQHDVFFLVVLHHLLNSLGSLSTLSCTQIASYTDRVTWRHLAPNGRDSYSKIGIPGVGIPGVGIPTTPIPFIKNCVKKLLYEIQRQGDTVQWLSDMTVPSFLFNKINIVPSETLSC